MSDRYAAVHASVNRIKLMNSQKKSFLILFWLMLSIFGCESMCANQILQEIPSPDKKFKAVVFQRDCGATTGFSTQVSIIKADDKLSNAAGNVFSADTNYRKVSGGLVGGPTVEVVWKGPLQLYIMHPQNSRIFKATTEIKISTGLFKSEAIQIAYSW